MGGGQYTTANKKIHERLDFLRRAVIVLAIEMNHEF